MTSCNEKSTDFEVNISSNDLEQELSDTKTRKSDDTEMFCDPCKRDGKQQRTAHFCLDCEEHLCWTCYNLHKKFKQSQHHEHLDITSKPESKTPENVKDICVDKCPSHTDRVIEYICQSCDKFCCSVCIIKDHRKCEAVDFIPDISENIEKSKVFLDVYKVIEDQIVLLEEHGRNCKINQYKSSKLRESAKEDVRTKCQEIHNWLIEKEKEMIRNIETKCNKEQQRFDNVSAEVTTLKDDLDKVKLNLTTRKNLRQRCQLCVALQKAKITTKEIERRLQELEKVETVQDYCYEEAACIRNIKSQSVIGTLEKISSDREREITFLYEIDAVEGYPGRLCMVSDKMLLLAESTLIALSLDPGKKEEPVLSELHLNSSPADITKISLTEVAVTFPEDGVIKFYDVTPEGHIADRKTIHVGKGCRGIQYFKNNFIVSYCHQKSGSIRIIDMSGQLKKEIVESSKLVFQIPISLALNPNNEILYVADSSNGIITSLTLDGVIINKSDNYMPDIYGIRLDGNGSIYAYYICSRSFIQLSATCSFVRTMELKELNGCVVDIAFSEKNNLMYACRYEGNIYVFGIV